MEPVVAPVVGVATGRHIAVMAANLIVMLQPHAVNMQQLQAQHALSTSAVQNLAFVELPVTSVPPDVSLIASSPYPTQLPAMYRLESLATGKPGIRRTHVVP